MHWEPHCFSHDHSTAIEIGYNCGSSMTDWFCGPLLIDTLRHRTDVSNEFTCRFENAWNHPRISSRSIKEILPPICSAKPVSNQVEILRSRPTCVSNVTMPRIIVFNVGDPWLSSITIEKCTGRIVKWCRQCIWFMSTSFGLFP